MPAQAVSPWPSVLALALVLALIMGIAWLLRKWRVPGISSAVPMRTIGALHLGARERVVIVEIGTQWHVLGVTGQSINAIAQLDKQDFPETVDGRFPPNLISAFTQQLAERMKRKDSA
jgi:flagellar protein FliO/FliZ